MSNISANSSVICRFAPSPTGFLHIGNIRTAIINYLFAKKHGGKFMLRFDDTDFERVKDEYRHMIIKDMVWLGLNHDGAIIKQSERLEIYEVAKKKLIQNGRIYECYETAEELEFQRKVQISSGQRPIYDRSALNLTAEQKEHYRFEGRKPYWRFLLHDKTTSWPDRIKGEIKFAGLHFSDPVIIRENDIPTYTFCSVVDDIEFGITDIIRGEDHVTNTAIQIQIFEALDAAKPNFSHLGLIQASSGKISKREGGFDIKSLREEGFEALSIVNLLAQIGVSGNLEICPDMQDLIDKFNLNSYSKSATNYNLDELKNINHKLLQVLPFKEVQKSLKEIRIEEEIDENFWQSVKANLNFLSEIKDWIEICKKPLRYPNSKEDHEFLISTKAFLPEILDENAYQKWIDKIKENSDRRGKELFQPIRLALTGKEHGPELKNLLPLIDRSEILARLSN